MSEVSRAGRSLGLPRIPLPGERPRPTAKRALDYVMVGERQRRSLPYRDGGPHQYMRNAEPSVVANIALREFNDRSIRTIDLHEYDWLFVRRQEQYLDDLPNVTAFADPRSLVYTMAQVNISLQLTHNMGLAEYAASHPELSALARSMGIGDLPESIYDLTSWQLERLISGFGEHDGRPSDLVYLSRRRVLEMFSFLGVAWTSPMFDTVGGAAISVIVGGLAVAHNLSINGARQGDHLFLVFKRRPLADNDIASGSAARGNTARYGAFAFTIEAYASPKGPSMSSLRYADLDGTTQYGVAQHIGYIAGKDQPDPPAHEALTVSGLSRDATTHIPHVVEIARAMRNMTVALTNYALRGPAWML